MKDGQAYANNVCYQGKVEHYSKKIANEREDSKELFNIANTLLHKGKLESLPSYSSEKDLANKVGIYFKQKVETITKDFQVKENNAQTASSLENVEPMKSFSELSVKDASRTIKKGNSKSCSLDPIPTSLLKECLPVLLPTIHSVVKSLEQNSLPSSLKQAVVKRLLKKSTLDQENLRTINLS